MKKVCRQMLAIMILVLSVLFAIYWLLHWSQLLQPYLPKLTFTETRRASVSDAGKLIRDKVSFCTLNANSTLKEVTTDEIWERMGAQIFQANDENCLNETFLIKNKRVYRLGLLDWSSIERDKSSGLIPIRVTDLDQDSRPELAYIHTSGAGFVFSEVAVWSEDWGEPYIRVAKTITTMKLMFDASGTQPPIIQAVHFDWDKNKFTIICPFGTVALEYKAESPNPIIQLSRDIPSELWDFIYTP